MLTRLGRARSTPRIIAVGLYIAAFTAVAAQAPYFPVYFESLGLPLAAIGLLGSVAALCGLAAAPAWGVFADRLAAAGMAGARTGLIAASLLAAGSAAGLALVSDGGLLAIGAVCYALSFAGVLPVLDAHALELVGENRPRYARLRVWGSVGFVVASVVVGFLIQSLDIRSIFVVLVASLVTTAVMATRLRSRSAVRSDSAPRAAPGLRGVLRSRLIMSFVGAALIAWSASTAVNGFLSIYLLSLGAPAAMVGAAWALGAVVEIPLMLAFPALAARFGIPRLVLFGAAMLLLRTAVLLVVRDPILATGSMAIHGAGFAFLLVGGITYVATHAPAGAGATAQGVLSGVVVGLAQAIGPAVSGLIAGTAGLDAAFTVALVASAFGLGALALALRLGRNLSRVGSRSAADSEAR